MFNVTVSGVTSATNTLYTFAALPTVTGVAPNPSAVGTNVTVSGTNFVGSPVSVTFGGVSATNVSVSTSTTLNCTVPSDTGTVNVAVTTPVGLGSVTASFTYSTGAAGQIATIPLSSFAVIQGSVSNTPNSDGVTTGITASAWANFQYWVNFPNNDYYQFVIPAYCSPATTHPGKFAYGICGSSTVSDLNGDYCQSELVHSVRY